MSSAVALDRLPRRIAELFEEAAANLLACANELDALADHPGLGARALEELAGEQRRIGHDIRHHAARSRRAGQDRLHTIAVAEMTERVAEKLEALGWAWALCPLTAAREVLATLRDCTRAAAHGLQAHEEPAVLLDRLSLGEQREREARGSLRTARRELLVDRADPRVGLCAVRVLRQGDRTLKACARLNDALQRHALA